MNNSNWFVRLIMDMYQDEKLSKLSNDGILLYSYMLNRSEITNFIDGNGEKYILVTEKSAQKYLRIKRVRFYALKKQLKLIGLIQYDEQKPKKNGTSTPIYVIPYENWKKTKLEEEFLFSIK